MPKWLKLLLFGGVVALLIVFGYSYVAPSHQSDKIAEKAPELGAGAYLLLPNLVNARVVAPDRPHDPSEVHSENKQQRIKRVRSFLVSTNQQGMRNPPIQQPKSGYRILCVGDSVTFGWGVSAAESYPSLLQKSLGVEVINAGVPAMKPGHVAAYLQKKLRSLQADVVLFARRPDWSMPQALRTYVQAVRSAQQAAKPGRFGLILPPVSTFDPRGMSQAASEAASIRQQLPNVPILDLTPIFHQNMPQQGAKLVQQNGQQQIIDRANQKVIVSAPAPAMRPGQPALAPQIVAALEADAQLKEPYFFDGGHPDGEGFRVFATAVEKWLVQQGWR